MEREPHTIGELLGEAGKEQKDDLRTAISEAGKVAPDVRFEEFKIAPEEEMGDAAGVCKMESGEVKIRADIVTTQKGLHDMASHVLAHEAIHQKGCAIEGAAELIATQGTKTEPVEQYRDKAHAAEEIANVIGMNEFRSLALRPDSEIAMRAAYVQERVTLSGSLEMLEDVAEEVDELLKRAA